MSGNDLWCRKCKSHHHPVECPGETGEEFATKYIVALEKSLKKEREKVRVLVDCLKQIQRQYKGYTGETDSDIEKALNRVEEMENGENKTASIFLE